MTTVYRKVKKPLYEAEEFVSRHCDWCKVEMTEDYGEEGDMYSRREFILRFTIGKCYPQTTQGPETGHKKGWEVTDLCDDCIKKLKDFLVSNGAEFSTVDTSW